MEAYITVVEEASSKLPSMEADELRSDVSCLLRQHNIHHNHQTNLNPIQCRAHTHNLNRTHPGWYLLQTRGWPWSSWLNKTTPTKHRLYYSTPSHTKSSTRIPPTGSKTN